MVCVWMCWSVKERVVSVGKMCFWGALVAGENCRLGYSLVGLE